MAMKKSAAKTTNVTTTKKSVPGTNSKNLPATKSVDTLAIMGQDLDQGSTGFENMGADDVAIPYISILQALSPQLRGETKIKGATEGDLFNTVTQEIYEGSEGIRLVPCAYKKSYPEWVPRTQGGGFVREHLDAAIMDRTVRDEVTGKDTLPNGNHVVPTAYYYCLLVKPDGSYERVVVAMSSSQLKHSRRWNSSMMSLQIEVRGRKVNPPMFSHIYFAHTQEESKDKNTWAGWVIGRPELISDVELYLTARKFHEDVTRGSVKVAPPQDDAEYGRAGDPTPGEATTGDEEDVF